MAVKTLKTGSTVEEKLDFLGEADMMKRFDHKNIVKLLGVCTRNEPIYTVMEFMLYGDLKTYLLARYVNKTFPLLISTGFLKYPLELKKKFQLQLKKKFS